MEVVKGVHQVNVDWPAKEYYATKNTSLGVHDLKPSVSWLVNWMAAEGKRRII